MKNKIDLLRLALLALISAGVFSGLQAQGEAVTFYLDTLTITQNMTDEERYTVPLRVLNFDTVSGFQIEVILEDPALSYEGDGLVNPVFSPPGQISSVNGNTLSVIYIDLSGDVGASLSDDTILFELDLRIIGEPGDCFPITVNAIEVVGEDPTLPIPSVGIGGDVCLRGFLEISGQITDPNGGGVDSVIVELATADSIYVDTTGVTGGYSFSGVPAGEPFAITPQVRINVNTRAERIAGINVGDIVVAQNELLGTATLTPAQLIAADTDQSEMLALMDLTTLAAYILFRTDELPGGRIYQFWPQNYVFDDLENPWAAPIPRAITNDGELEDRDGFDFFTVKLGDVNLSSF